MKFEVIFSFKDGSNLSFTPEVEKITIGRDPSCTIALPLDDISRKHITLKVKDDKTILVTDMGSKNGTFVNSLPLAPNAETVIAPTDTVEFGSIKKMMVRFPNTKTINLESILKSTDKAPNDQNSKNIAAQVLKTKQEPKLELQPTQQQTRQIQISRKTKSKAIVAEEKESNFNILPLLCIAVVLGLFAFYYMSN